MLAKDIKDLIGSTPLYELKNIEKKYNLESKIYAKLECFNLTGSIKDRIAYNMIIKAQEKGLIKEGATIIEPTSGNTGIGISAICASLGYKAIITMPETMSKERRDMIQSYGAEIVLTPGALGMNGAVEKAKELHSQIENSFIPSQFDNLDNPNAHYMTTGEEIYNDLNGKIDYVVAGIGTGGTITGIGTYLKEVESDAKLIGVEPMSSPLLTEGHAGKHKIQGIGANFIPNTLNKELLDEILTVSDDDAINITKEIAKTEGLSVGISSGAALKAAIEVAKSHKNTTIVVIFPDSGSRYLSVLSN